MNRELLRRLNEMLKGLVEKTEACGRFIVVDTNPTVAASEWRNEIHPTPKGFEKVARKVCREMCRALPQLSPPR